MDYTTLLQLVSAVDVLLIAPLIVWIIKVETRLAKQEVLLTALQSIIMTHAKSEEEMLVKLVNKDAV